MRGQVAADLVDRRDRTRLVDLPELGEAAYLAFEVAARASERGETRRAEVGGVDLDQRVDEVEPERPACLPILEAGRQLLGDHVAVDEARHVERDAENALVVADGDDLGEAVEAGCPDRRLQVRLAHHVVR